MHKTDLENPPAPHHTYPKTQNHYILYSLFDDPSLFKLPKIYIFFFIGVVWCVGDLFYYIISDFHFKIEIISLIIYVESIH